MENGNYLDLKTLLINWKLEHFYEKFREQNITVVILKILKPTHIEKLTENYTIGHQAIFEANLEKWKNQQELDRRNSFPNLKPSQTNHTISVKDILFNTYKGKEIDYSNSDCSQMENEICLIFPTEQLEFYTNGKRGKIYNKLSYLKRISKDILKKDEDTSPQDIELEHKENYSFYVQQIKNGSITADEFDLYWRKSAPFRFKQIVETNSTKDIFNLWPEYIKPCGFQLIDIDFSLKYPNAKSLHERWSQFADKIIYLLKTKITSAYVSKQLNIAETKDEESKILTSFWCIQRKVQADSTGAKIRKKFTIADSQEAFVMIAATYEELEAKLNLIKLQGRSIKPKLLVVGELYQIKEIYLYIDNVKYPTLTILNAIDYLFKSFFVFNLRYPEESEVFYCFVESFLYDLPVSKNMQKFQL